MDINQLFPITVQLSAIEIINNRRLVLTSETCYRGVPKIID